MDSQPTTGKSVLRTALAEEAGLLTELAIRSKGFWEYDPKFLRDCRAELTVTPEYVLSNTVIVVEEKGLVVGFYSLEKQSVTDVELVHMFVEPDAIGNGQGRQLFQHAVETARGLGFQSLIIKSDPYAESFYNKMGAERIGVVESNVRTGRTLPLFRFGLSVIL